MENTVTCSEGDTVSSDDLFEILAGKWEDGTRPKDLYAQRMAKRPSAYVDQILHGLSSKQRRVQGGCAELASLLSAQRPDLLYPHFDCFARNLDAKAPIARWEAACCLGNFAPVDKTGQTLAHIEKLISFVHSDSIVLQGHAARALGKIAAAHSNEAERVLAALLNAQPAFAGNRIGVLVEALEPFVALDALHEQVRGFVEPLCCSDIKSVASKARRLRKKLGA
jgi:hypothetical protein